MLEIHQIHINQVIYKRKPIPVIIALFHNCGHPNPGLLFNFNNPNEYWHDSFKTMLNPRCKYNVPEFTHDLIAFTSDGDENGKIPGQHGQILKFNEAYCGSGYVVNAWTHFNNWDQKIELRTYPYVCFAFKGAGLQGRILAHINYYSVQHNNYKV